MTSSPTSSPARAASELRRAFLDYFRERGHTVVPSSPLVPNDASLLFTTAGMVQFKPYYTTAGEPPYTRAASVQKCLRLTDLENVGSTPRHDTFFEMLGNFSFGPREKGAYFKEEAIAWAWEFVTRVMGMPQDRLYASVFEGEGKLPRDDEAIALWKKVGLPESRIVALGRKDNFWGPAGGKGACGPSSEIYFDLGERRPSYLPDDTFWGERPGDPGDRYMEFWNLVFPQFDAQADGSLQPLPRPGIDTGMGLERLALVVQGRDTIFDTDLFAPLVEQVLLHRPLSAPPSLTQLRDARVVADHLRALTFAVAEGALPGNEGAGYVLRRLLRRAVTRLRSRQGLAIVGEMLPILGRRVIELFGDHYQELKSHADVILRVLEQEELAAAQTVERGGLKLEEMLVAGKSHVDGDEAFRLHDTFGFSIEELEFTAAERGITVDRAGFERAMEEQRSRAREASKFKKGEEGARAPWTVVSEGTDSEFLGYERLDAEGLALRRWRAHGEAELELVLDRTPCYAEAGGQVADRGRLVAGDVTAELAHVWREDESIVHRVPLAGGARERFLAAAAGGVAAHVAAEQRLPTMRHHTATHLLHAALRSTLGTHVRQAGSLVAPDRLRFDYTHFEAPTREQLDRIDRRVAEWVLRNRPVSWTVMPLEDARRLGAMALFGEKYGARVRVVTVEGVEEEGIAASRELCGGTHVSRTGDIGAFLVVSDTSIAAGVRRIEALCGHEALRWLRGQSESLHRLAAVLQTAPGAVLDQVEKLRAENERLKKAQAELERGGLEAEMARLAGSAVSAPHGRWVVGELEVVAAADALREAADRLRGELKRGAAVVAVRSDGKLTFLAAVTDDLVSEKRLRADELVRTVAKVTGGSGGGKPHLALAGGKDASKLGEALAEARRLLAQALSG